MPGPQRSCSRWCMPNCAGWRHTCLAKDRNERHASAADSAAEFDRWLRGEPFSHLDSTYKGGESVFRAEMQADTARSQRQPSRSGEETWEGSVFLPRDCCGNDVRGRFFFAKMKGPTMAYSFMHTVDTLSMRPSAENGIFRALLDSEFTGEEWVVRQDAAHCKSKTYGRSELSAR